MHLMETLSLLNVCIMQITNIQHTVSMQNINLISKKKKKKNIQRRSIFKKPALLKVNKYKHMPRHILRIQEVG